MIMLNGDGNAFDGAAVAFLVFCGNCQRNIAKSFLARIDTPIFVCYTKIK